MITLFNLGNAQIRMGQFDAAIASYRSVLSLSPGCGLAHYQICEAMLLKGDAPAALAEIAQEKSEDWRLIGLSMAYHALGRKTESDAALATLITKFEKDSSYNIAYVYAFRGDADKAFDWLDKAVQCQNPGLSHIAVENLFDKIHQTRAGSPSCAKSGRPRSNSPRSSSGHAAAGMSADAEQRKRAAIIFTTWSTYSRPS